MWVARPRAYFCQVDSVSGRRRLQTAEWGV